MFFRIKPSGPYRYLQLVENHREGYRTVQRVLFTLGRLDKLTALAPLMHSCVLWHASARKYS